MRRGRRALPSEPNSARATRTRAQPSARGTSRTRGRACRRRRGLFTGSVEPARTRTIARSAVDPALRLVLAEHPTTWRRGDGVGGDGASASARTIPSGRRARADDHLGQRAWSTGTAFIFRLRACRDRDSNDPRGLALADSPGRRRARERLLALGLSTAPRGRRSIDFARRAESTSACIGGPQRRLLQASRSRSKSRARLTRRRMQARTSR